jgi:hypothetical protein
MDAPESAPRVASQCQSITEKQRKTIKREIQLNIQSKIQFKTKNNHKQSKTIKNKNN